jgi:uncharacterized membrane protein YfhO
MDSKYARHLTFALAGATVICDALYLIYLRHHHMVRAWSGTTSVLLGLFMLAWSISMIGLRHRWASIAIACIGIANVVVGAAFFF